MDPVPLLMEQQPSQSHDPSRSPSQRQRQHSKKPPRQICFFFSCHGHTQPNKFLHATSPANDQTLSGYEGCVHCNSGMQELEKQAGSSWHAGTPVFLVYINKSACGDSCLVVMIPNVKFYHGSKACQHVESFGG